MNWKIGDLVYIRKGAIPSGHRGWALGQGVGMIISITPLALTAERDVCEVYLTSLRRVRFLDYQLEKL